MKTIRQQARYGGELVEISQNNVDRDIKIPTVYAMLRRQTRDGLIEIFGHGEEDGITRGTSRKYYKLTKEGIKYLELMEQEIHVFSELLDNIKEEIV